MIIKVKYRLSPRLVREVLGLKRSLDPFDAGMYNPEATELENYAAGLRKTEVRWVEEKHHRELYAEIGRIVVEHQRVLGVDGPLRFASSMQLATYREGHHFTWHRDVGPADPVQRLISISVLLSDDFTGGQMEFKKPESPMLRKPGDMIMFTSDEMHRVVPVISGTRNSLVAWCARPLPPEAG